MSIKIEPYYFNEVAEIVTGNTPSTTKREFYVGNTPFVSPAYLGTIKLIYTSKSSLTDLGLKEARLVPKNMVLLCCIAGRELVTNQQINSLIFNPEKVDYPFGYYYCSTI